jgi:hypothetical protein
MTEAVVGRKQGVAIVANDKISEWLLPFLESYRASNAETELYLIPYDDDVELTRRAAEVYGATWVEDDMRQLDELAKRLYPLSPYRRRRLRKLQSLALPLDRVVYIDVDTLLFRDVRPLFERLTPGETDFVVASTSDDYVYNDKHSQIDFLKGVVLFSDGFWLTSRHVLGIRDFQDVVESEEKLFHAVRKRGGLYAQPLVNFVVHRRGLRVRSLSQYMPGASDESFYKVTTARFAEDGLPVDLNGCHIYFMHWAGAVSTPKERFFDGAWLEYAKAAAERMSAAGAVRGRRAVLL